MTRKRCFAVVFVGFISNQKFHRKSLYFYSSLKMFVTTQIIIKERTRVYVPVNFDKLLFPCRTNSNYVSTITSTTKVSVELKVFARKL